MCVGEACGYVGVSMCVWLRVCGYVGVSMCVWLGVEGMWICGCEHVGVVEG